MKQILRNLILLTIVLSCKDSEEIPQPVAIDTVIEETHINLFKGKISEFKSGCFMPPDIFSTYKSCSGCGIISFKASGAFEANFTCDDVATGKWRLKGEQIIAEYSTSTLCNHFVPEAIINDAEKSAAFCKKFQRDTAQKGILRVNKNSDGSYTLNLPDRFEKRVTGQLYAPYFIP